MAYVQNTPVITPNVTVVPQSLNLTTVGNSVTFPVPDGMGTFAGKIAGLAGGAVVQFQGTSAPGVGTPSVFRAYGGNPYGGSTTISQDASWAIVCAGLVQVSVVVVTAGTGSCQVGGTFSAAGRISDARLADPPAPYPATSAQTAGTTSATAGTFTIAAAANTSRKGGLLWNTSAGTLYVYFGSGAATTAASFPLSAGQSIGLNAPGVVLTDQVQVAASTASATYVLNLNS